MSDEAKRLNEIVQQRKARLTRSDPKPISLGVDLVVDDIVSPWMRRLSELDDDAGRAWDERDRRIRVGSATPEDLRVHQLAEQALRSGAPFPPEASRMPGPELPRSKRTWHPEALDNPQRAVAMGIPPLIAEEIARGDGRETRSTRACARVGFDYLILVLIGERGCGKTYAAARWLWQTDHARFIPFAMKKRVRPRRFLEAHAIQDVPYDGGERAALGDTVGLVIDDLGVERDAFRPDVARLLVQRYRNGLPTVVTTNLSQQEIVANYGMRIDDRLAEVGRFVVVSNDPRDSLRRRTR